LPHDLGEIAMIRKIVPAALVLAAAFAFHQQAQAAAAAGCAAPLAAQGLTSASIESGGALRSFSLYLPRGYSGEAPVPLVLDLQASGITPAVELQVTGLDRAAEAYGFAVVLPAAATASPRGGFTWNIPHKAGGPDDVAFIADLLDALQKQLCIDPQRIYAVGYSGGARLASQLACAMPGRIAAIGAVAGLRYPRGGEMGCDATARPVPVLAFHSIDDPVNPYHLAEGKHPPYWTYGVDKALALWAEHNDCPAAPARETVAAGIERFHYAGCREDAAVEFYRLAGSGHTWPGSGFDFPDFVGATEKNLDATALTVNFLLRHRLPAR
jgi:polyhydroxybutyrate depolymerase